ncbi:hypothetical protein RUND412_005660 [Rhizina undulata]
MDRGPSKFHRCCLLLRNLSIAFLAYATVTEILYIHQNGTIYPFAKPSKSTGPEQDYSGSLSGGVNWKLRPETLVAEINDAFLGPRPDVDTYANFTRLIEGCRGSLTGLEKMRNVYDCLAYLADKEDDYLFVPESRPSKSSPEYPTIESAAPASKSSPGTCPGPIQLYHTYWTGPSTWRVEIFVKSYLYTQNIPCSRLYLWLDSDAYPNAVNDMKKDPGFARFMPLVERGDIVFKAWNFPSRIPLPKGSIAEDPSLSKYVSRRGSSGKSTEDAKGEVYIGDGVVIAEDGSEWLVLTERQMTFLPVAVSDAVRFIVLHLYGGVYLDMDVLLLRDMRPLLLPPDHSFAERWAVHTHPGDYNTAVLSLSANSSLSSYLVRGGVRMGLNFHPRIIGRMAWKDGRVDELKMFETGLFDPIWGEFNWGRMGRCTVPCFKDYGVAFMGTRDAIYNEWESYDGKLLPLKELPQPELKARTLPAQEAKRTISSRIVSRGQIPQNNHFPEPSSSPDEAEPEAGTLVEAFAASKGKDKDTTYGGKAYNILEDRYPPNNRTLENFFRGAWSYHVHNQWLKHPQPSSWFDVMQKAHDGFFRGERVNPYGERWSGPDVAGYERWAEFE